MLLGATGSFTEPRARERLASRFAGASARAGDPERGALAFLRPWGVAGLDAEERVAVDPASGSWLVLSGHVFRDLASGREGRAPRAASLLLPRLASKGVAGLGELDGSFALAWFDGRRRRLHLVRDRFGEEPLCYGLGRGGALFGSRSLDLVATGLLAEGLCPHGLASFLTFGFVPGEATLDAQVRRVPSGGVVVLDGAGNVLSIDRWYRPVFEDRASGGEDGPGRLRTLLEEAVARRAEGPRPAALLEDEPAVRAVASLARRCATPSLPGFDAAALPAAEEDALALAEAVGGMDVPVSDPGRDIATFLAGRKASEAHDLLVAGSGAEEIFASHPSYAAQARLAALEALRFTAAPLRVLRSITERLSRPDDPADWRAGWKRLVPPPGAPRELGAFRWRVLREPDELLALATVETVRELAPANPWKAVLAAADACDAPARGPARDLAVGTMAASVFAQGRLLALRRLGVEARLPCYDSALAEHAARIPAAAKLARNARGPRLLAATLLDVLPAAPARAPVPEALAGRWLAGEGPLGRSVARLLAPEALRARGLFRPESVRLLLAEHRTRRRDHSARLWSLVVLELWLRARDAELGRAPVHGASAGW